MPGRSLQGLDDSVVEDEFSRLARLTEEADEAQTKAVEKVATTYCLHHAGGGTGGGSHVEGQPGEQGGYDCLVAEFKSELETIHNTYKMEHEDVANELADAKAKTGNKQVRLRAVFKCLHRFPKKRRRSETL
eukprot:1011651-Pyramimonas_sp.AAC.1